jgi:hypothetical protein
LTVAIRILPRGAGIARAPSRPPGTAPDGDGLLHDPGALDDLRQEHLAGAEQVADRVHARHQRPFDDVDRMSGGQAGLLRVSTTHVSMPLDEGVAQPIR